jgi:23S rRNA pseudouridine1911/1915/1917 synthase
VPRLDVWLAGRLGSRSAAQAAIAEGRVTVDGVVRPKSFAVDGSERIEIGRDDTGIQERPQSSPVAVVYEDDEVLVVDKAPGVVVHPAGGVRGPTLVQALAGRIAGGDDPDRPGVVHRLDRDTSGLIVLARTPAAHALLSDEIRHRRVEREYVALVQGRPPARVGTIDAPLGRDRRRRTLRSSDTDEPREAITHFETEETFAGATLLKVTLETGRTHQIRAHFKAIGHPVLGDKEYGVPHPGLDRQFLHARRLAFLGREFRSELPPDLAATLNELRNPTPDAVPPVTDRGGRA